ncbi:MAG: hypothetical protein ACYCS2_00130 [Acidimicrobiales bacterium]
MATALLGLWLVRNWLAGAVRVVAVSADTVDGATAGWTLALLVWGTLAAALILAIRAGRKWDGSTGLNGPVGGAPRPAAEGGSVQSEPTTDASWPNSRRKTVWWTAGGAIFVLGVYHGLLLPGAITWGDWGYFINASAVKVFFPVPSLWSFVDLGTANILGGPLAPVESAMGAMARLGVPYPIVERLCFYLPAVVLSYAGAVLLARRVGAQAALAAWAGAFYAANPYALILVSGGQLTVGVGYALFPWVALAGMSLWAKGTLRSGIALGAVVGVQAWFDPRTAWLSVAGMATALLVLAAGARRPLLRQVHWRAIGAAVLVLGLAQGPWLVPAILAVQPHLAAGYTTASALQTFSLMSLADGLTVFHPFWPTMKFIALHSVPVLWLGVPAMVAVALTRAPRNRGTQLGAALYLVFAALVSGANMPFGVINGWLFSHIPGMDVFRDPSPYFGPAALGVVVAVAAGFSPQHMSGLRPAAVQGDHLRRAERAPSRTRRRLAGTHFGHSTLPLLAIGIWGVTLVVVSGWPALSGALRHDLAPRSVPAQYATLAREILSGPDGAVLWVPNTSRFAPVSPAHPSVSAFDLTAMTGAAFPQAPQGLSWLGVPSVVDAILQQYDIRMVVVREDPAVYRELLLSPVPTQAAALTSLTSVPGSHRIGLPGLTVFRLGPAPYPLAVFGRSAGSPVPGSQLASPAGPAHRTPGEELEVTSYAAGLPGWQPVGDANNFADQSLAQAGISASVGGRGSFVRLTVRYGAVALSRSLPSCPSPGFQEFRVRYRTSGSAPLTAAIFSATQASPVAVVTLPATMGKWAAPAKTFVLAPTLATAAQHLPLTKCLLALSAPPAQAGVASAVDVGALSLSTAVPRRPGCATSASGPAPVWCDPTSASRVVMGIRGDRITANLPPAPRTRLLVFWQHYNPGWVARTSAGQVLRHVQVNGWANGFVLPGAVHTTLIQIVYLPQRLVDFGYAALLGALTIVVLGGLAAFLRRRPNRTRR